MTEGTDERASSHSAPESVIRERLRVLIESGALPANGPERVEEITSDQEQTCGACGLIIPPGESEFQLRTQHEIILAFHRRCLDLWACERPRDTA